MILDNEGKAFEDYEHSKKMDCDRAILFRRWEDYQLDDDEKHYVGKYIDSFMQEKSELWLASANREGYKLVPLQPTTKIMVAIERKVEEQLEASAIDADPFRLDGENIYKAMIGACDDH